MNTVPGREEIEALRKLLHVAEAASASISSWPLYGNETSLDHAQRVRLCDARVGLQSAMRNVTNDIESLVTE